MVSWFSGIMSGAVDKLELGGGLTSLSSQVTKVKSQKTSKMNLLRKAIDMFEEDPNNLEILKNVCKGKQMTVAKLFLCFWRP